MKKLTLAIFLLFISLPLLSLEKTKVVENFGSISIITKPSRYLKIDKIERKGKSHIFKSKLSVGEHLVTLYCKDEAITETFKVLIEKDKDKKIIKKYSNKCKKSELTKANKKKHKRAHHTKYKKFNRNQKEVPIKINSDYGYLSLITRPSTNIKIKVGSMIFKYKSPIVKLKLPTGIHRIWLNNESREIKDTFNVKIEKGKVKPIIKKYEKK